MDKTIRSRPIPLPRCDPGGGCLGLVVHIFFSFLRFVSYRRLAPTSYRQITSKSIISLKNRTWGRMPINPGEFRGHFFQAAREEESPPSPRTSCLVETKQEAFPPVQVTGGGLDPYLGSEPFPVPGGENDHPGECLPVYRGQ